MDCYASTNNTANGQKEEFYSSLQSGLDHTLKRNIKILLDAKVDHDNTDKERVMGRHESGCMKENGERAVYRLGHWWDHFFPQSH